MIVVVAAAITAAIVLLLGLHPVERLSWERWWMSRSHDEAKSMSLDEAAHEYVKLALALGERDPDALDYAVVPEQERAAMHARYLSLDDIARGAQELQAGLRSLASRPGDQARIAFLELQVQSISTRVQILRGKVFPFDSEAELLFDVRPLPDEGSGRRKLLRAHIAALLPRMKVPSSYSGEDPLAERYAAYDRKFLVPPDRVNAVMRAALTLCRDQTLTQIRLPAGESVELVYVRNKPWSAFSRYVGSGHSLIQLNLDLPITVDEAMELACHEAYPGHHTFNTLRELASKEKHFDEMQVQLTFSPQSFVSEAAAAYAPRLAFTRAERLQRERDVLFPLAGLPKQEAGRYMSISEMVRQLDSAEPSIAEEYLDGRLEFVRAEQKLSHELLMAHAEALLLYLNEYRTYMLAYTDGPRRVERFLEQDGKPIQDSGSITQESALRKAYWARYQQLMSHEVYHLPAK
jgi:hypothetical protein